MMNIHILFFQAAMRCTIFLIFALVFCASVWAGQGEQPPSPPKLTCKEGSPCKIPVVDPTTTYHELSQIFAKTKKNQSCIAVSTMSAAFGINAGALDEDSLRTALNNAYSRQRNFGEDPKLPRLIFYADSNGTIKPLDARTLRDFLSTELFVGPLRIVSLGKKTECVVVDTSAADSVTQCLAAASEQSPPADSCKAQMKTLEVDLKKPQLAKVLGSIKVEREEITISEQSVAPLVRRAKHAFADRMGGDKTMPGCVVQFGVTVPDLTEQLYLSLKITGISSDTNWAVYNCSPDEKSDVPLATANAKQVQKTACSGQEFEWDFTDAILEKPNTQPLAFLISFDSNQTDSYPFVIDLTIDAKERPGATPATASWKLTGACTR
jgi:hypothetical protein